MSALVPAAALAAAASVFLPPPVSIVILLIAGAGGISISANAQARAFAVTLVVCSVGVAAGLGGRVATAMLEQQRPGLPPGSISTLAGFTSGNSTRTDQGTRASLRVTRIGTENLTVSAVMDLRVGIPSSLEAGGNRLTPGTPVEVGVEGINQGSDGSWYATAIDMRIGAPPAAGVMRARAYGWIDRGIERSAGAGAPLLRALLLGERSDLTARTEELFRRAGVTHVLALSGMHLAIIAALVVALVRPLFGRRAALVAGGLVALVYTLLIGGRPSLVRATLMCEIAIVLMFVERPLHLVEIVAAAFLFHLVVQPAAIRELSFQLSYLALCGIAVISPALIREVRPWLPAVASAPVAAGVGAQIAGAPVLIGTFGRLHPIGIVAGAVITPLVSLFMVIGIAGVALGALPLPLIGRLSARLLSVLATAIEGVAWWFSAVPALRGGALAAPAAVICAVSLLGGVVAERRRITWTGQR